MLLSSWLLRLRRPFPSIAAKRHLLRRRELFAPAEVERLETRVLLCAPTANNDSYTAYDDHFDTAAEGKSSVLANDLNWCGGTLTAVLVSGPSQGTLTLGSNGHFLYTPNLGYVGSDSFTYKAYNGMQYSGVATVSLTVNKTVSARTNLDDLPSAGATPFGEFAASPHTGDAQVAHAVAPGHVLLYSRSWPSRPTTCPRWARPASWRPG